MKIGIDITAILYNRGVSRYTKNLVRALQKTPNNLYLFGYSFRQKNRLEEIAFNLNSNEEQNKILPYPQSLLSAFWRFGFPKVTSYFPEIDVFHSWDWLQPPDKNIPLVSTIHDLAILKFQDTAHPKILKAHQRSWQELANRKAQIIAVSNATKRDIVELLGYPAYKITVVHEALPEEFKKVSASLTDEKAEMIIKKLQLTRPYILFVGTREPRKNLERLVEAWQPLAKDFDLLIAGDKGWDELEDKVKKHQYSPRFLGGVSDHELAVLYMEASIFAYPSLYEGFGLPILESFHYGTPVVTSNNSGMLEVAGNACELVDPFDVQSITKGMQKVLSENLDEQRKRLQRMIIRQQMFDWKNVANQTLAVYKKAIQEFGE